jgi:DNA-binding transcriptional LysR family regulator
MALLSQDLYYFLKVSGGLTLEQAARELGVTQPAVSRALHRLEENLEQKLFSRQRRQLHLTPAGLELKQRAEVWKSQIEKDLGFLGQKSRPQAAVLRLGFHAAIGVDFVAPILKDLTKQFPELVLHYHLANSTEVQNRIHQRQLDIGIVVNALPKTPFTLRHICHIPSAIYGRLREDGALFINPNMVDVPKYLRKLHAQWQLREVFIPDYDFMAAMVKNGMGAALLPDHIAERFDLKLAETSVQAIQFDLSLTYLNEELSPQQKIIARALEELLKRRSK